MTSFAHPWQGVREKGISKELARFCLLPWGLIPECVHFEIIHQVVLLTMCALFCVAFHKFKKLFFKKIYYLCPPYPSKYILNSSLRPTRFCNRASPAGCSRVGTSCCSFVWRPLHMLFPLPGKRFSLFLPRFLILQDSRSYLSEGLPRPSPKAGERQPPPQLGKCLEQSLAQSTHSFRDLTMSSRDTAENKTHESLPSRVE